MFGIDPDMLKSLASLQQQILAFMAATDTKLAQIQAQLDRIEANQTRGLGNG